MQKAERVRAALKLEAVDRPPYSFWTHLPDIDRDPEKVAQATLAFARRYDIDFIKSMPNGLYAVEDWGCVCDYGDIARGGTAIVNQAAVAATEGWSRLDRLDVTRGAYGRELEHLRLLVSGAADVPVLATVFSPLTIAAKLSNGASRTHARSDPARLTSALDLITETTCEFGRRSIELGCAGVFFAIQEATTDAYDDDAYRHFGERYDRKVLGAVASAGGCLNVLHVHGENILFDVLKDYNVAALNWHIGETPPSIAEYRSHGGAKPIVGGLRRANITNANLAAISADIAQAIEQTSGGRGLLISPACVIRHPVNDSVLSWTAERIKALESNTLD